ncbi:unnamed protein product [Euphydryas editha]|nr:unnamed protein product [Euphydryas editha]
MNNEYRNKFTYNMYDKVHKLPRDEERLTSNEKMFHDKTTYCRPVINYYNEEFIYKTMERNARLKRLVRKLAIARQRERETVSWNNFINDIKNKHGINPEKSSPVDESEGYITPEIINDYYNTKFSCVQSRPCKHLLQEFYGINDECQSDCTYYPQFNEDNVRHDLRKYLPHERNPYCYPTSSQGRLIIMERERRLKRSLRNWPYNLSDKNVNITSEIDKKYDGAANTKTRIKNSIHKFNISHNRTTSFDRQASVQADIKYYPNLNSTTHQDKATYKIDDSIDSKNETYKKVETLQETYQEPKNYLKKISLINIDTKLETLIESINTFIDEIKSNKLKRKKFKEDCLKCKNNNNCQNTNLFISDSINKLKTVKIIDKADNSENTFYVSNLNKNQWSSKINELFQEENVHSSKSLQINNMCTNKPCSVQISFEIPTKDCSTEVTRSLSKQNTSSDNKDSCIEEISTPGYMPLQRMTIAVNTDPLSFLGLLQISTDTFKRLLSYVPNFDYYSYLSLLQFPVSQRKIEPHYVCNICGADFNKPSKLSDHIRDHNLGKTKDCCVCRHVLDTTRKISGLFRCRYCGQLFARAYCCELHQESCARRLGRRHDVSSSLMMLR